MIDYPMWAVGTFATLGVVCVVCAHAGWGENLCAVLYFTYYFIATLLLLLCCYANIISVRSKPGVDSIAVT